MSLGHETEQIEFKKSTSELKEGVASISAILNKHHSGVLYFGVRNDGTICGQEVSESTLRKISQAISNFIKPTIHPIITEETSDLRSYIKVMFSGDDTPYACDGRYRIRVADEDVLMSPEEVRRLAADAERRQKPWDKQPSDRSLDDVDETTLRDYVKRGNACERIPFEFTNSLDVFDRLGLLHKGRLSNAAAVLFCPSRRIELKMGILESHTRAEILDLQQESGTIFSLVRKAELYILNNTRRRFLIKDGNRREEIPELPREAVHEAVMNAYAHRDWTSSACVQIDIFYDSVEIFSPGWFIEGQDPDAHLKGESTSSSTRNELIVRTLYRSKDVESYGTGIPRIKYLCDQAKINVEYRRTTDGTKVIFHRNDAFAGESASEGSDKVLISSDNVPSKTHDKTHVFGARWNELNDNEQSICSLLLNEEVVSSSRVAEVLGIGQRGALKILHGLIYKGFVDAFGSNRNRRYRLAEEIRTS